MLNPSKRSHRFFSEAHEEFSNEFPIDNESTHTDSNKCRGKMEQVDKDATHVFNKEKNKAERNRKGIRWCDENKEKTYHATLDISYEKWKEGRMHQIFRQVKGSRKQEYQAIHKKYWDSLKKNKRKC